MSGEVARFSFEKCLIDGCTRQAMPVLKRGLCMPCYKRAKKLVSDGKITWEGLATLGLARLEVCDSDPFSVAFKKATEREVE